MSVEASASLIVYGDNFCGHTRRLVNALKREGLEYEWRDVSLGSGVAEYREELRQLAKGHLSVPTVVFPDGSVLIEPPVDLVLSRLKPRRGLLDRLFGR